MSNHDTSTHRIAARPLRALGYHVTSRVRCAARYARLAGVSIHEAAQVFGISAGGVWNAWARIWPCRPQPLSDRHQRPTCTACGQRGHLAINGKCSPSELALRLVRAGMTVRAAADRVGTTTQAVYAARDHRRRAA